MWRREERLEYWLAGGRLSEKPCLALWLKEKLSLIFRLWRLPNAVREQSLRLDANAISLDEALSAHANVLDGFGALGRWTECSTGAACELDEFPALTRCVDLMGTAVVRSLRLPNEYRARIQQGRLAINPNCRSSPTNIRSAAVHALEQFQNQLPEVKDGDRLLMINPAVGMWTSLISEFPHMRASLDIDALQDSECKGFLHEAEILKGVPAARAELIAVFRHVPIEMISRLRFLAEKNVILYSIWDEPKRTHTRVHDLAAIRDTASQEIHLVPHRTQFRSVSLN
jgi:hypothetical protein